MNYILKEYNLNYKSGFSIFLIILKKLENKLFKLNQFFKKNFIFKLMKSYLKEIKTIYETIINYLENEETNTLNSFAEQKMIKSKDELKMILKILSKIANNHRRSNNLIQKIEKIIETNQKDILSYFAKHEIFDIFEKNKNLLLFLFKENIIIPDNHIFSIISNFKNSKRNYPLFFYPEFKSFINNDLIQQNQINFEEFDEKRQIGENDNDISYLIRNDLIDEFIIYVNKTNLSLSKIIEPSIYETNDYLIDKTPSLIEYTAFYGSFQIFQFLRLNRIELQPSIWIYAIHGRNADIIHLLEENDVSPSSYLECMHESIKCHHNELMNYICSKYIDNFDDTLIDILIQSIKHYNIINLSEKFLEKTDVFYYLCKYDYSNVVSLLLESKTNNIDINYTKEKKKNILFEGDYEKRMIEKKSPLTEAVLKGNQEIVEILAKQENIYINSKYESSFSYYNNKGVWAYVDGKSEKTALFLAVEKGYSKIVQLLINHKDIDANEENIEENEKEGKKKLTALHLAVENEQIEIIKLLLSLNNIDVNPIEYDQICFDEHYEKTPLSIAVEKENLEIVQLLLSKNYINPNIIYNFYYYIIVMDGINHEKPITQITPLQSAIIKENKAIIQALLNSKKIDINYIGFQYVSHNNSGDKLNKTALHIAVEQNDLDIVKMLLSYEKINVNTISIYNYKIEKHDKGYRYYEHEVVEKTALLVAVENDNLEIIKLLLEQKNIDVTKPLTFTSYIKTSNPFNNTRKIIKKKVLDVAIQKNNQTIINTLKKFLELA